MAHKRDAYIPAFKYDWLTPLYDLFLQWTMRATAFKRHSIEQALTGLVRDHHHCVLMSQLAHPDFLDEQIDALSAEVTRILTDLSRGDPPSMLAALSQPLVPAPTLPQIPLSIAHAVVEKGPGVKVIDGTFGWFNPLEI